eukprot:TRINITY_DN4345_c3_g1_i2.p1 TRINITY_DN4345_c3_g1~~TRINITY_DN4345_c3_g1_i2.p1  ORF type:complete len:544 (+),score=106.67 TRINITY_DN4345_c3_g1_i2:69-1634(+)
MPEAEAAAPAAPAADAPAPAAAAAEAPASAAAAGTARPLPPRKQMLCAVVHSAEHVRLTRLPRHPQRGPLLHALLRALGVVGCAGARAAALVPRPCAPRDLLDFHKESYVNALDDSVNDSESGDGSCTESEDSLIATKKEKKRKAGSPESKPDLKRPRLGTAADFGELLAAPPPQLCLPTDNQLLHGLADDCPPFKGMRDHALAVAGGTLAAADALVIGSCLRVCHFEGGRHHARGDVAAGFCYVADVVLGAIRLLRRFQRVLIVDIDVHHGDGTEEAFYSSNRVMCLSFHMHGDGIYPPASGCELSTGKLTGKGYNVNLPFRPGCSDEAYRRCFRSVAEAARRNFKPDCVILVAGADALHGDPLGLLRLSAECLLRCAAQVRDWGLPTLTLGAGGYSDPLTARYWAHLAALMADDGTRWPAREEPDPVPTYGNPVGEDYPPGLPAGLFDCAEIPSDIGGEAYDLLTKTAAGERDCGIALPDVKPAIGGDPNGKEYINYLVFAALSTVLGKPGRGHPSMRQ